MAVDLTALPQPGAFDSLDDWATEFVGALQDAFLRNPFILLPPIAVANLPPATQEGLMAYVVDQSGAPVPAYTDGANWRKVTDGLVVS